MTFSDDLHEMIFSGSLLKGGTWGGPTCAAHIAHDIHLYETIGWIVFCFILYKLLNLSGAIQYIRSHHQQFVASLSYEKSEQNSWSTADGIMLLVIYTLWFQVLYYKIQLKSLVNLLQPCHLSLMWQGLAILLSGRSSLSPILALITLPMTIGAVAALAVPATEGLDQPFEKISFFIQHYVLLVTPLYLLLRQNFTLYKVATFSSVIFSNWFSLVLHWGLFALFDRYFEVNVNFFLCPSEGLQDMLGTLPSWVQTSYRTHLSILLFFAAIPLCYLYIGVAALFHSIFHTPSTHTKKVV